MGEKHKSLVVDAVMENLDKVTGFVEHELFLEACPLKVSMQVCVSLEEIYVNVVNYAYPGTTGKCEIILKIESKEEERELVLTVRDNGKPFDPLKKDDPDITLAADERSIGGLGIYMVKKSMDNVTYENISGYNTLTMYKKWQI